MANEALAAGVADRIRRSNIDHDDDQKLVGKRVKFNSSGDFSPDELEDEISMAEDQKTGAERQIDDIWKKMQLTFTQTAPQDDFMDDREIHDQSFRSYYEAASETSEILQNELEKFFRDGLEAFHKCDSLMRQLNQSKELCDARGKELLRLQISEAESKTLVSVSNLSFIYQYKSKL
jgi:hypothetical protein